MFSSIDAYDFQSERVRDTLVLLGFKAHIPDEGSRGQNGTDIQHFSKSSGTTRSGLAQWRLLWI